MNIHAHPRRSLRRPLFLLLLTVLILVVAHSLLWRWSAAQLQSGLADWLAVRRAQGWTITTGAPQVGGWPLNAEISLPQVSMHGGRPDLPTAIAWEAERVRLHVALISPRTLEVDVSGPQKLQFAADAPIPFTADVFHAVIPLDPGAPPRGLDLDVDHLRAGMPTGGLTAARLRLHSDMKPAAPQGEPALSFRVTAGDIGLPPPSGNAAWPLGARIASITLEGAFSGPVPRAPDLTTRATGWRDGGGTLELQRVAVGWGPLGLSGSATLALDEKLQPMGAATARVVGPAATLDALAAAHTLDPRAVTAAKAVLALITHTPDGGGAPEVDVPLTLQDRSLTIGRIPLARLPELSWPQAN